MVFMKPEVVHSTWVEVTSTSNEVEVIQAESCGLMYLDEHRMSNDRVFSKVKDYVSIKNIKKVTTTIGYGVRLNASGYLDCTEWSIFYSLRDAWLFVATDLDVDYNGKELKSGDDYANMFAWINENYPDVSLNDRSTIPCPPAGDDNHPTEPMIRVLH